MPRRVLPSGTPPLCRALTLRCMSARLRSSSPRPLTRHGLAMVETTTAWLQTHPVPRATTRNTVLGLGKQVLWRHSTRELSRTSGLVSNQPHGLLGPRPWHWVGMSHPPSHTNLWGDPTVQWAVKDYTESRGGGGTFERWDTPLAKATGFVITRGSANGAGPARSELPPAAGGDNVPTVHTETPLGKTVWVSPATGKGEPIRGIAFAQGPGGTWGVRQKEAQDPCAPPGDVILGEKNQ